MARDAFNVPEEYQFKVRHTADKLPYVLIEDVRARFGDGIAMRLEEFLEDKTRLKVNGETVACLWDLNEFLKVYVPVGSQLQTH